jgi:hypothetical protein
MFGLAYIWPNFSKYISLSLMPDCVSFLLGLLFNHEDGSNMLLQNVSQLSLNYTALYPRR